MQFTSHPNLLDLLNLELKYVYEEISLCLSFSK